MISEPTEIVEKLMEEFNSSQNGFILKFSETHKHVIDIYTSWENDYQPKVGKIYYGDVEFEPFVVETTYDGFKLNYHEISFSITELGKLYTFLESVRLQNSEDTFNSIRERGNGRSMPVRTVKAFRVWNSYVNKYIDLATEVDPYCNHIYTSYSEGEGLTTNIFIEPCSWRKDCDNNFIYDGDIVDGNFLFGIKCVCKVIFNDGEWIYQDMSNEKSYLYEDFSSIKIVGNVHTFSDKSD